MRLTFAFVMDPVERVNVHTDTTFALMLAAQERGHRVFYAAPGALEVHGGRLVLMARPARLAPGAAVALEAEVALEADACHAIFVRTDPPFDVEYLEATWLLSLAERRGTLVVNSAAGLRSANEKLYALEFPDLCPPTLVSRSTERIEAFVGAQGGDAVVKPIDGHGGFGVLRLRAGDSNLRGIVELLTLEGRRRVVVQRFVPEGTHGDKRLHVLFGELRGAVRRIPKPGDHRGNVHAGGSVEVYEPGPADRAIVEAMRERLVADGLLFVGLDVIGDRLIEVNVTSPTLLQELARLGGPDLASELIAGVEARVR